MNLSDYKKHISFDETAKVGGNPPLFGAIMILFKDGEFILIDSDTITPQDIESYDNILHFAYTNKEDRINCLHIALVFIMLHESEQTTKSFRTFEFTFVEFIELYDMFGFTLKIEELNTDDDNESVYILSMPFISEYNAVKFSKKHIVKASCLILSMFYSSSPNLS